MGAVDRESLRHFPDARESAGQPQGAAIYTPIWEKPGKRIPVRPFYPPIGTGGRNICLASLAGQLHTAGYQKEQIYAELLRCNQTACRPLLPEREIRQIVNSITRYWR